MHFLLSETTFTAGSTRPSNCYPVCLASSRRAPKLLPLRGFDEVSQVSAENWKPLLAMWTWKVREMVSYS